MKQPPASRFRRKPTSTAALSRKIKLICSFNGAFHLRPPLNRPKYVGGETRIVSVDRNIGLSKLCSIISDLCPKSHSFSLKYKLSIPARARDANIESDTDAPLVSVSSDEDVRWMIEDYEKLELYGKKIRLWIFVCSNDNGFDNNADEIESYYANSNSMSNVFGGENDNLFVDLGIDASKDESQLYRVDFDKVKLNPVNVGVGRLRSGDDSLRKLVLRQNLLAKKLEAINTVQDVNTGSEIDRTNCVEDNKQICGQPLKNLASDPREDLYQGNMTDCKRQDTHLQGSRECDSLVQNNVSRLHPLNPRDGNLQVEENGSKHCLNRQNFAWNSNNLHDAKEKTMSDYQLKKDLGINGHGSQPYLNRENIVPSAMHCPCNSQWCGNAIPVTSQSPGQNVSVDNQDGIKSQGSVIKDAQNPGAYPYHTRNHKSNEVENRNGGLNGRLSPANCHSALKPYSDISKQVYATKLCCTNSWKPAFNENVIEGRTSSGFSDFRNFKSKNHQLTCDDSAAAVNNQSCLSCLAVESPSSCFKTIKTQEDILTGSRYERHEVPCRSACKNHNAVSIDNELFTFDKQDGIPGLSDNPYCSNRQEVDDSINLTKSDPENGINCREESRVASSVNLVDNLSLSTTNGEPPASYFLNSSDVNVSLLNPETKPSSVVDGELIIVPKVDISAQLKSSASNAATEQKDQVQEEEIEQNLMYKDDNTQSIKSSKATDGISTDLVALYTHLAARHLQTIKHSDLEYVKELGSGTYGTVYHGKWKGSDVAIKKIKPSCFTGGSEQEDRLVADFWKEAHILGQLHHPNIVAFYGVVTDGPANNLATVTEYMVNGSLQQVLQRKDRTIDRRKRIILAMDAAFGMGYLHEKNIVHFDLKPHNFLVNMRDPQRPVCKIGDLGLSKIKQRTLVSGGVRGTIPWMAPELLNSENKMVTEKVDVFSFGIVMWELLTGEEPYSNLCSKEIIGGIIKGNLRPKIPSWCDPMWRSLMERCWSSDPGCRPSFSEIVKELRAMAAAMNIK